MAGITERNKMKNELVGIGYSLKYIDEWQPKTILYRHKPSYFAEGGIADEVGTFIENVPGNPDYVMRKAKIGLFTCLPVILVNADGVFQQIHQDQLVVKQWR